MTAAGALELRVAAREVPRAAAPVPVTARLPWQLAAIAAARARPVLAALRGPGGRVDASAVLACRDDGRMLAFSIPRAGTDDAWGINARTPQARSAVAGVLLQLIADAAAGRPWQLQVTGLRDRDTSGLLAAVFPGAQIRPAPGVPYVQLAEGIVPLRPGVQRTLRRAARRIAAGGPAEEIRFIRDPDSLLAMRPEIEAVHRARDHSAARPCDLDDPAALAFWRVAYSIHAARGELEVATLRLGGRLAAYTVAFTDPPAYRVFDSRMAPGWPQYAPGRRLEAAVLDRALSTGAFGVVDWMSAAAPEALIAVTGTEPRFALSAAMP